MRLFQKPAGAGTGMQAQRRSRPYRDNGGTCSAQGHREKWPCAAGKGRLGAEVEFDGRPVCGVGSAEAGVARRAEPGYAPKAFQLSGRPLGADPCLGHGA